MLLQTPHGFRLRICCGGFCFSHILFPNWWKRHGMSHLFTMFSQLARHVDLARPNAPLLLPSLRAPFAPRMRPSTPKHCNPIRTTLVIRLCFVADVSCWRTERFCTPLAIYADVSPMSYGGTHKQTQRSNPRITSRHIWMVSFGCSEE